MKDERVFELALYVLAALADKALGDVKDNAHLCDVFEAFIPEYDAWLAAKERAQKAVDGPRRKRVRAFARHEPGRAARKVAPLVGAEPRVE